MRGRGARSQGARSDLAEFVAGLLDPLGGGWVFLGLDGFASGGGFEAFGFADDEIALVDVFDVALDLGGAGGTAALALVGGDATFFGELGEVGADVAIGGAVESRVDVGVELEHEVPGGDGALP